MPSVLLLTLSEYSCCRVLDNWHSAKHEALGIDGFFGSYHGSSFVDLIVWDVVVQTKFKMDISKESYHILKCKIYKKMCARRALLSMQTLTGEGPQQAV